MKPPTPIFISTRQFAELAGVHDSVIHAAVSRRGHFKGIHPQRRGDSTGWAWPAEAAYVSLGLIGPRSEGTVAGELQRALIDRGGVDPLSACKAARWLTDRSRPAGPAGERVDSVADELALMGGLVDALADRGADALKDEGAVTVEQRARLRALAGELVKCAEHVAQFVGWLGDAP